MGIWFKNVSLEDINTLSTVFMAQHLGIEFIDKGPDYLCAKMPVDNRTRMPRGILHGGASCVLAETVGSVASALCVDPDKFIVAGLEINANHLRGVQEGFVTATARPVHLGRTTHVWDIRIIEEASQKMVCISRLTVAVIPRT